MKAKFASSLLSVAMLGISTIIAAAGEPTALSRSDCKKVGGRIICTVPFTEQQILIPDEAFPLLPEGAVMENSPSGAEPEKSNK